MGMFSREDALAADRKAREELLTEIAELRAAIKGLTQERADTRRVTDLERQIEKLKLEKDRLTEDNDRKIRETTHKVGLLKLQQDHDVANAKRQTMLEVREENLSKDQERFEGQMEFFRNAQREEIDRLVSMQAKILERLPNIEATFEASMGAEHAARARKAKD